MTTKFLTIVATHAIFGLTLCGPALAQTIKKDQPLPKAPTKPTVALPPDAPPSTTQPATGPATGPRVGLSANVLEFGDVWQGTPVSFELKITNTGSQPLVFEEVKASCGCTTVRKPQAALAAGASDVALVKYDTTHRIGVANQNVRFKCNDPALPEFQVPVRGNVRPLYTMSPMGGAIFPRMVAETERTITVSIQNLYPEPAPLKLKSTPQNQPIDVTLTEIKPGAHYELVIKTRPPMKPGPLSGHIILETAYPTLPEVQIALGGYVAPRVHLSQDMVVFPRVGSASADRTVRLSYLATKPVKITRVVCNPPEVTATVTDGTPPPGQARNPNELFDSHLIKFSLNPVSELPPDAVAEVYTDDSEFPKLVVRLATQKLAAPAGAKPAPTSKPSAGGA